MSAGPGAPEAETRLWDLFTRFFHWALAGFVTASWILGEWGPGIMTLHFQSGYVIGGLLVLRLIWGFVGPRPARFASFLRPPGAVLAYARTLPRRAPSRWAGHNPMGGWWVAAMLALLALQVLTGLVSDPEDFINIGPFARDVPVWLSRQATGLHEWLADALLAMVALHLAAIAFYRFWKREDLVGPMVHGRKTVRRDGESWGVASAAGDARPRSTSSPTPPPDSKAAAPDGRHPPGSSRL